MKETMRMTNRPADYDIIIRHALIIDGTGKPCYPGDLAIKDEKIVLIQSQILEDAKVILDVQGHVVCPGFIDAHGHSDFTLFVNPRGESKIHQGITTEVTGNCGFTAGPITEEHQDDLVHYLANTIVLDDDQRASWKWKSQDEFLRCCARDGLGFNVVPLVGQGMIHVGVMGFEDRMPTAEELEKMKTMLRTELEAGFFGMSMAFAYEPGNYMSREEVLEMCKLLKEYDCIYTIHTRDAGEFMLEGVDEVIEIAEQSGCKVQYSHLKAKFPANWGKAMEGIRHMQEAFGRGIDIGYDTYPYIAYGSGLIDVLPPWVKKDGPRIMCERLENPQIRSRVLRDMKYGIQGWDSILKTDQWDTLVQIATLRTQSNKWMEGLRISQIAEKLGCSSYDLVIDLMIQESASVKCIWFAMDEKELTEIMRHPMTMFGTDGRACATYGELGKGAVHPRYYGTYPRILGHYVRGEKIFSLEEAIYKSTLAVAHRFGINARGEVREGNYADLVIFSQDDIIDTSTFDFPHNYPVGIDYVLVNGKIVIDHGEHTGNLPGRILRKR